MLRIICCICCLLTSICCYADSLIITYSSGKTQKIPLEDSIKAINTLQYLTSEQSQKPSDQVLELKPSNEAMKGTTLGTATDNNKKPSNGNVKFRWANPIVGE